MVCFFVAPNIWAWVSLFLPVHFYMLSLAITAPERLDRLLRCLTIVKLAEFGLVFLLAVHLFGGLRLMVKFLPWSPHQKTMASIQWRWPSWCRQVFFESDII